MRIKVSAYSWRSDEADSRPKPTIKIKEYDYEKN